MSHDKQRLPDYMGHILEAIERIERYTEDLDEVAFLQNEMAQDAVIRNFEIIGEASHNIESHYIEFAAVHPELPLAFAYQMRNAVYGTASEAHPGVCKRPSHLCRRHHRRQSTARFETLRETPQELRRGEGKYRNGATEFCLNRIEL